jgi:bifunctional UDP-N-acetylglucosamine pyrophosphorylase/glucosamine-1-phosphate N-acetyltransferase
MWKMLRFMKAIIETADRIAGNYRRIFEGANILDPLTTWIGPDVRIGPGAKIEPNVQLIGKTTIGARTRITSGSRIEDSTIGADCEIRHSFIEDSTLFDDVRVGPCARIRGGSQIEDGCHIGNYAEVNRSKLGSGVKQSHFSYLGDATVGARANIAAGAITANFDGTDKHKTFIGEGAFIGSGAVLVAPVTVGRNAKIGANAVVKREKGAHGGTIDVPDGETAVGIPARILGRVPN